MTDEEAAELGRRVVACKGFRWLPGMKVLDSFRVVESVVPMMFPVDTPDLRDAATLGCLLALVREAWGDPGMFVRPRGSKMRPDWAVFTGQNSDLVCAASKEAEALVVAWEAAP